MGRDVRGVTLLLRLLLFQSTRPHGARLRQLRPKFDDTITVSIHAPTWGATYTRCKSEDYVQVSIHAPTWGATPHDNEFQLQTGVSIHAPTWGATESENRITEARKFQSTRPHGARRSNSTSNSNRLGFNPRAHMGRDC